MELTEPTELPANQILSTLPEGHPPLFGMFGGSNSMSRPEELLTSWSQEHARSQQSAIHPKLYAQSYVHVY